MEELRKPTTSDPRLINNNRLKVIRKEALLACRVPNDLFIGNVLASWLSAWFSSLSLLPFPFCNLFVQLCCVRLFLTSLLPYRLLYFIYSLLVQSLKGYVLLLSICLSIDYSLSHSSFPFPFFQRLAFLLWQCGDHAVITTWPFIYYHISFHSRTNCNIGDGREDCFIYIHLLWEFQAGILIQDCFVTTWHKKLTYLDPWFTDADPDRTLDIVMKIKV
jgi:hypothetical protein